MKLIGLGLLLGLLIALGGVLAHREAEPAEASVRTERPPESKTVLSAA